MLISTTRTLVRVALLFLSSSALVAGEALPVRAAASSEDSRAARYRGSVPSRFTASHTRTVQGTDGGFLARTGLDSFRIYGGPGSGEGTFQTTAGTPSFQGWTGVDRTEDGTSQTVGDFSKVRVALSDLDPCATNTSPQMTFVDDGTPPANRPGQSTGGVTSTQWTYGVAGGWVVHGDGGVGVGTKRLWNEVWSPEIELDDPGTTLDDTIGGGLVLRYTAWMHLPLENGIFHVWSVRSWPDPVSGGWSEWVDRGALYYSDVPRYVRRTFDVSDLLVSGAQRVQIALGVIDLSEEFGFAGDDTTPAPWLDDVELVKYTPSGPSITIAKIDTFHDGFAHSGLAYDPRNLSAQATRLDTGRDINGAGTQIVTGDSMVVRVAAVVPGSQLVGPPVMTWFLRTNALFDPVRFLPSGAQPLLSGIWRGTVIGQPSTDVNGRPVRDTWFFDLPDGPPRNPTLIAEPAEPAMYYPGDRLWVAIEAHDTFGNTTFDILDPSSWEPEPDGGLCGRAFPRLGKGTSTRDPDQEPTDDPDPEEPVPSDSLPGVWDIFGKSAEVFQPRLLVWDDAPELLDYLLLELALAENGLLRGPDFDVFRTREPESGNSTGLGASAGRGATPAQIADYDIILHLGGTTGAPLLSDGSNVLGNDKGNDVGLLTAWRQQELPRTVITFADRLGSTMHSQGAITQDYLLSTMGVAFVDDDVSDRLGGVSAPVVLASGDVPVFASSFSLWSGCGSLARRDEIDARLPLGAVAGHHYSIDGSTPLGGFAASVVRDRTVVINSTAVRRLDVSFPFSFAAIREHLDGPVDPDARTARAQLIGEVLEYAGYSLPVGTPTSTPRTPSAARVDGPIPNPFNPTTMIALESERTREVNVVVFDTRGRRVRTLHAGLVGAGRTEWQWDGRDDAGRSAASGVYLVLVSGEGVGVVRKAVLAQ